MHATTAGAEPCALARPSRRPSPLINRQFALLWAGGTVSGLGDIVFATTLALWIVADLAHGRTWAPLAVSGALLAAALPDVLVGPLAGVFVDRWDRRQTMLIMDALRAALVASLLLPTGIVALPGVHPPAALALGSIYAAVFLAGVCGQFFGPSRMAAIGALVAERERPRASSLTQASSSLATIVGPPIAAALYFALGAGPALILNALSFAGSWLAIRAVRLSPVAAPAERAGGFRREFAEGLRYFTGNRVLTTVLVTAVVVMLGGGALNALDIFFLIQNLHAPIHLFGLFGMAMGAGVLVGAVVAGAAATRLGLARTFWLSAIAVGLLILIYARLTSVAPAIALLFVMGLPQAAVNVAVGPLVLNATPPALIGRVVAVLQPLVSLAAMVSLALAGWLASGALRGFHAHWLGMRWGEVDTIFTGTGLLIVAGGLFAALRLGRATQSPDATRLHPGDPGVDS
jgi:MFS family permease